jgi:ElaB/YqjD/DUF883 family membrane-anchored ribosome-binding protein
MSQSKTGQGGTTGEGSGGGAEQLRDMASQVGENIRDLGGQVRDVAAEKYGQLRDQASDYYEQGRQRAMEWEQGLEQYVQEQPIKSLLIAAGAGLLLGLLWRRH